MPLSDTWLKANLNRPREKVEVKSDRDGLSARITAKGKIVFQLRYRYYGKACRIDLGSYPGMTLKAARAECLRLKAELEQGHDPKVVRRLEKQAIRSAASVEELFRQWYQGYCSKEKAGHQEILRTFEIHVLPRLGNLPAEKAALHSWLDLLEPMAAKRPGIAERILTNTKQMYKWGMKRHLVEQNPLSDIHAKEDLRIQKSAGSRTLSDIEIRYLWDALEHSRIHARNQIWVKMCLLYGCRLGEVRLSKIADYDLKAKVWTVPPENHKMGKKTNKPLKRPILPVVEEWLEIAIALSGSDTYLITARGTDQPLKDRAHLQIPQRIQQWVWRHHDYQMPHWSIHDLRRTARTNFSPLTLPHIAEVMLGHKLPGQWMVYDHHDYLEEQREAYEQWWERLQTIVG